MIVDTKHKSCQSALIFIIDNHHLNIHLDLE